MKIIETVTIGDISDAWAVNLKDINGEPLPLSDFSCRMAVVTETTGEEVFTRSVTQVIDGYFQVFLTEAETLQLVDQVSYLLVVQIESDPDRLPKPIKKEMSETFKAVAGFI